MPKRRNVNKNKKEDPSLMVSKSISKVTTDLDKNPNLIKKKIKSQIANHPQIIRDIPEHSFFQDGGWTQIRQAQLIESLNMKKEIESKHFESANI